ncbi:MAG: DUF262 domain-containing protein [Candidatus Promineifilaceae bacterium]
MDNGQKTIASLFDGRKIFHIPKYQRAYAWEERQLQEFLEDFENQNLNKAYFFGTILFQERAKSGNFEHIDIVDGQQRITTLVIFMKVLLAKLKAAGDDVEILEETYVQYRGEYKLRALPIDNEFFQSYILQDSSGAETGIDTTSQKRLWNARCFFEARLSIFSPETLREFKDKIERTKVLTYSVIDNAEATLIFETTNDRGKPLNNLEKTKSFLMYKTYLVSENAESRLNTIQDRFSKIYRHYEAVEDRLGEDMILQYHFIASERWGDKTDYQQHVQTVKRTINDLIKGGKLSEAEQFIDRYSHELRETFAVIKQLLLNPTDNLNDVFALQRPANFYPLLIKAYKHDDSPQKDEFDTIVRLAEAISFLVYGLRGRRSNTGRGWLYSSARDFNGDFASLRKSLRQIIQTYCNEKEFGQRLMLNNFYHEIGGRDKRYLLWKYENFLRRTEQPVATAMDYKEFTDSNQRTRLSIEHIVPQNPKASPIVNDVSILPTISEDFKEKHLHSLGNLTLDSVSANSSKSNHNFSHKEQHYFRKMPFKTQNELVDFLNPKTGSWDAASIEKRQEKILNFALKHWGADLPTS